MNGKTVRVSGLSVGLIPIVYVVCELLDLVSIERDYDSLLASMNSRKT